jgi:LemA protein
LKRALIPVLALVAAGIAAGSEFVSVRNNLYAQRAAIDAQWTELSGAFDRRAALIANLAELIRPVANPKDRAFADAEDARKALTGARAPQAKIQANANLMNAFARLYLAAEGHPKLTASAKYRRLNEETGNAESRVAVERRKYNDLLEHYNAQLQKFPANVVAGLAGLTRIDAYVRTEQEIQ